MRIRILFSIACLALAQTLSAAESVKLWEKVKHTKAEQGATYLACSWNIPKQGRIAVLFEIKTRKPIILELKRNNREDFPDGSIVDQASELGKDFAPIKLTGTVVEAWNQSGPSLPNGLIERLYQLRMNQTIEIDGSVLTVCETDGMTGGKETDGRVTGTTGGYVSLVCSPRKSWRSKTP